jgi:SAM-dependent methyltransferase
MLLKLMKIIIGKRVRARLKNYVNASSDFGFYRLLNKELKNYESVLDVGCGESSPLARVDKTFYLEGIDLIPVKSRKRAIEKYTNKIHDKYTRGNILNIEKYYKRKSFDVVVLFHVLEHLKRSEGKVFLKKLENIAKYKIIICTPNGFIPQNPLHGNIYQEHLSGWYIKDFKIRGFRVYGLRGLKFIRGELAAIKYEPWYIWLYLSYLSEFITIRFPQIAFELMAVKILKTKKVKNY